MKRVRSKLLYMCTKNAQKMEQDNPQPKSGSILIDYLSWR